MTLETGSVCVRISGFALQRSDPRYLLQEQCRQINATKELSKVHEFFLRLRSIQVVLCPVRFAIVTYLEFFEIMLNYSAEQIKINFPEYVQ